MRVLVLAVAACGRIGFDPQMTNDPSDAANDTASAVLRWTGTVSTIQKGATTTATFSIQGYGKADAIVLHTECDGAATPTTVVATAPGWTFGQLGQLRGMSTKWGALFGAIAPDAAPTSLTITYDVSCGTINALADAFMNADPIAPFEAFDVTTGTTDCTGTVTTASAGDAIWAACSSGGTLVSVGAGYTKAADDTKDDWSEYKLTSDPAGTIEQAQILSQTGGKYVMTTVAIKPR